jgi:hypothetical protein
LGILRRIVRVSSKPGDTVLDFFAGSGTTGAACLELGRKFVLVDNNPQALQVMARRFEKIGDIRWVGFDPVACKPTGPELELSSCTGSGRLVELVLTKGQKKVPRHQETHIRSDSVGHVTIIAIATYNYESSAFPNLQGPKHDIDTIKKLFLNTNATGLFAESQLQTYENPTLADVQHALAKYAVDRSAKGDVLIFYFSGHGCPIGSSDFGFCLKDTIALPEAGAIPTTVLKFTDLIQTLLLVNVHPIIIVDACVSGRVANSEELDIQTAAKERMYGTLYHTVGQTYALLCSCAGHQLAVDTSKGGVFTQELYHIAKNGLMTKNHIRKKILTLQDIFGPLEKALTKKGDAPLPQLFASPSLDDFPFCRNVAYSPVVYRFLRGYCDLIKVLWNGGKPKTFPVKEIPKKVTNTTYGNHKKLSRPPWSLVYYPSKNVIALTPKGQRFAEGKIKIPLDILHKNPNKEEYEPTEGTRRISINDI